MGKDKAFHPTAITTIPSSNFELGEAIAKLRYDQICELMSGFIFEAKKQIEGDRESGKVKLVEQAEDAVIYAEALAESYALLTIQCEPYMKEEFEKISISTAVLSVLKQQ